MFIISKFQIFPKHNFICQIEAINKLKLLGDNRIIVINSNEKIQYFKNIVKDVMPDIQQELEEEMKLAPVSKIIKDFESEVPNE